MRYERQDPAFGADPVPGPLWQGPGIPPVLRAKHEPGMAVAEFHEAIGLDTAARLYSAADALTGNIAAIPGDVDAAMSYVDNYGGWGELTARFGRSNVFLVSITIFGGRARCADMESGAMATSSFPGWLDREAIRDEISPPWGYTNAANMGAVIAAAGNRNFIRWSAHVGYGPHVCAPEVCGYPRADWTQWSFESRIDRSVGYWLPHRKPPAPPPIPGGDMIASAYNPHLKGVEFAVAVPGTGEVLLRRTDKPYDWHSLGFPFGKGVKGVQLTAAYDAHAGGTALAAYNPHDGEAKLRQVHEPYDWKAIGNPGH